MRLDAFDVPTVAVGHLVGHCSWEAEASTAIAIYNTRKGEGEEETEGNYVNFSSTKSLSFHVPPRPLFALQGIGDKGWELVSAWVSAV